jgi:hypothetical protein
MEDRRFNIPHPEKSYGMKITASFTENKRVAARNDAYPIFMRGGAPKENEVLSEGGLLAAGSSNRVGSWWRMANCTFGRSAACE